MIDQILKKNPKLERSSTQKLHGRSINNKVHDTTKEVNYEKLVLDHAALYKNSIS